MARLVRDVQGANITDVSTTATSPGTGADATTWTGAQCTAAYNDIAALNIKFNLLINLLEVQGIIDIG